MLFKRLSSLRHPERGERPPAAPRSLPGKLLERAEASAGTDPQRAFELRRAALAYLGVVR